ncbi:hypothetical protein ACFYZI_33250 [Streptomyces griseorubiginosus]|uniref:hypothetical protein n=1 Tax=Streptomyces griseorubiginosus TaxID=67304 RepID=UPI00367DAB0D
MTTVCDLVKPSDIGSATGLLHDLTVRGGMAMTAPIKLVRVLSTALGWGDHQKRIGAFLSPAAKTNIEGQSIIT